VEIDIRFELPSACDLNIMKATKQIGAFWPRKWNLRNSSGIDKGLFSRFLRMSPKERLKENDNAVRGILELRNAYQR